MADAADLKSAGEIHVGSTPTRPIEWPADNGLFLFQ